MLIRILLFRGLTSTCLLCIQLLPIGSTNLLAEETITRADRLNTAKQTKVQLEVLDDQFAGEERRLIDALDKAIINVPTSSTRSDFSNERQVLVLYIGVTDGLIRECDTVLTAQEKYLEIGHQYANNLTNAGPTFVAAAAQCREFAAAEPYDDTRQDYLLMADIFESLAARCEQLPNKFGPQVQAVEELHPYLQNGRQVLARFRDVLQAIPVLKSDTEFDALDKRLKSYVESYEKFRGSLRQLQQRLQTEHPVESNLNTAGFRSRSATQGRINRDSAPAIQFTGRRSWGDTLTRTSFASQAGKVVSYDPLLDDISRALKSTGTSMKTEAAAPKICHFLAFRGKPADGDYVDTDGWCRAQIDASTIAIGDAFRVQNRSGNFRTVRVVSEVTEARKNDSRLWYAEIVPAEQHRVVSKFAMQK